MSKINKLMTKEIQVYTSCGNVFADLGFENLDEISLIFFK